MCPATCMTVGHTQVFPNHLHHIGQEFMSNHVKLKIKKWCKFSRCIKAKIYERKCIKHDLPVFGTAGELEETIL